jgi:predicted transcriptional regulator
MTITLPSDTAERLRKESRQKRRPVSRLIYDALEEQNRQSVRERMIEGYKATREENQRLAEEWLPLTLETWPSD